MSKSARAYTAVFSCSVLLAFGGLAHGYGSDGHRIAGVVALTRLCERARTQVEILGGGQGLDELGLWADSIRSEERWTHTGPWHYMNVGDDASLENYRHPREGDILWAIAHFGQQLADFSLATDQRLDALRFVTHFVVDIHQPLHVGRASDRGGNQILVNTGEGGIINLHRFWDSAAVALAGMRPDDYAESLLATVDSGMEDWSQTAPLDWARESQKLRAQVYDFSDTDGQLGKEYLDMAMDLTRRRLAQAGVRLAVAINQALCDGPE